MKKLSEYLALAHRPGEAIWSLSSRQAKMLNVHHDEFLLMVGTTVVRLCRGEPEALKSLADATGTDLAILQRNALVRMPGWLHRFGDDIVHSDYLASLRLRLCPCCIADDIAQGHGRMALRPYYRVDWFFRVNRVCPIHLVDLIEVERFAVAREFRDFAVAIEKHLPNLEAMVANTTPSAILPLQQYLHDRRTGKEDTTWFAGTPFHAVIRISELLGFAKLIGRPNGLEVLPDEQKARVQSEGFRIGSAGPSAVNNLLAEMDQKFFKSRYSEGPARLYGFLYYWLDHFGRQDPSFEKIMVVIREHVLDNLPVGGADLIFGEPALERRVHSIASLTRHTSVPVKRIRQMLLDAELITPEAASLLTDERVLVRADLAEPLVLTAKTQVLQSDMVKILGASFKMCKTLVKMGHIPSAAGTMRRPLWVRADIDRLLGKLRQMINVDSDDTSGLVSLRYARSRCQGKLVELLTLLLEGKLKRVGSTKPEADFSSILIDPDEFQELTKPSEVHNDFTIPEIVRHLSVTRIRLGHLVGAGLLSTRQIPHVKRPGLQTLVTRESVDAFLNTYCSSSGVMKEYGITSVTLGFLVRSAGIEVVQFGKTGNRYFRRREIDPIVKAYLQRRR